jgi:glutamate carboxypeptidase
MDVSALPFDDLAMLGGLRAWVECESPTFDAAAVNRCLDLAAAEFAAAGAAIDRIPGRMGLGDCVRARFPHPSSAPGILVLGHMDTVHPIGTLDKLPFRVEGDRAYGPGILDMKCGNYAALEAMRQLKAAGIMTRLPVTVLLTCDEEIGSPSTRELIEQEARRHAAVLVVEPGLAGNGVVTGRYAIARFNLETTGVPSHAGVKPKEGRSAIREMARQIALIEDMTTEDCTFSVGVIHGGQWVNCVTTTCVAEALSMAKKQSDLDRGVADMLALSGDYGGVKFKVTRGVTRPVWEPDERSLKLYGQARDIAKSMGFDIFHQSFGGGSDGNFTGALGIPTLDNLGPYGDGYHTLNEYVLIPSLSQRGRLIAGLLATIE